MVNLIKQLGSSSLFLVMTILLSAAGVITILSQILSAGTFSALLGYLMQDVRVDESMYKMADFSKVYYIFSGLLTMTPFILLCSGLWAHYATSRSTQSGNIKTGGLKLVKVASIIQLVLLYMSAFMILIVSVLVGIFSSSASSFYNRYDSFTNYKANTAPAFYTNVNNYQCNNRIENIFDFYDNYDYDYDYDDDYGYEFGDDYDDYDIDDFFTPGADDLSFEQAAAVAIVILAVIAVIVLAMLVLYIIFYHKLISSIGKVIKTADTGAPMTFSKYVMVLMYIMGICSALSALSMIALSAMPSFIFGNIFAFSKLYSLTGFVASGCQAAAFIIGGILISKYNKEMTKLSVTAPIGTYQQTVSFASGIPFGTAPVAPTYIAGNDDKAAATPDTNADADIDLADIAVSDSDATEPHETLAAEPDFSEPNAADGGFAPTENIADNDNDKTE